MMGIKLETTNLEYTADFAERFQLANDPAGAALQERVAAEEIGHVRFATRWFERWTGGCDFETWAAELPPPLSPWVMHGDPIARDVRAKAGMSPQFLAALASFVPEPKGRQLVPSRA